jgi:coenzyme F420-reducing hydrogenase gamma subunit
MLLLPLARHRHFSLCFVTDSYSIVRGVDKLIPVDIYLPGCPPKPEATIDAITKLRRKIAQETYRDKTKFQRGNRCSTVVKSQGSTLDRRWKLPSWSTIGAEGISGGAMKCVEIGKNTNPQ